MVQRDTGITTDTNTNTLKIVGNLIAIQWTGDNETVFMEHYPFSFHKKDNGELSLHPDVSMPIGYWLIFEWNSIASGKYVLSCNEVFAQNLKPQFDKLWNEKHQ